jgi:hypothetical protein
MKTNNNETMVMQGIQVHTTTDYFLFKTIGGNRTLNKLHFNRLKKSMIDNYLFTVIVVNENYQIIDGQHRFNAIKELNLPLYYIICEGYGLNEVHILNQNSKVWNSDDYLEGYCNLGYNDYITYRSFKDKYKIGHREAMCILAGSTEIVTKQFYAGKFKIKSLAKAEKLIDDILSIEPYYTGVRRRAFIFAMMLLLRNGNFKLSEFINKLKNQPTALKDCINSQAYRDLIEDIYNYRRKEKVNLRF